MTMTDRTTPRLLLLMAVTVFLGACSSTGGFGGRKGDRVDAALERAARHSAAQGHTEQSLALLENVYKRNPEDSEAAFNYARALREYGRVTRASLVLGPFARNEEDVTFPVALEYATLQTTLGNHAAAETFARQAVLMEPESGEAYHILGIALDAQGEHAQAAEAFNKALDLWQGDPAPVLNNLGLNLATQGFIDEALDTLRRALAAAPDRIEIERNLRIVSALNTQPPVSGWRVVPKPSRKPGEDIVLKVEKPAQKPKAEPEPEPAPEATIEPEAGEPVTETNGAPLAPVTVEKVVIE